MDILFAKSLRKRFDEWAIQCPDVSYTSSNRVVTIFQAKCLLMRCLGFSVRTRDIADFLYQYQTEEYSESQSEINLSGVNDSISTTAVPQLTPLETAGAASPALTGPTTVSKRSQNERRVQPTPKKDLVATLRTIDTPPAGYMCFEQFSLLVDHVQAEQGFSVGGAALVSKLYTALDPTRKGFVDVAGVQQALRANDKVALSNKAALYFSSCDELKVGRMSTPQAKAVLLIGADELATSC